jgi:hypothetical protein
MFVASISSAWTSHPTVVTTKGWQAPPAHVPPWHEWPHAPQLFGSLARNASHPGVASQSPYSASHLYEHAPFPHAGCAFSAPAHAMPQEPQLLASTSTS